MKWIKASERLPADPYELVCMRGDGGGCYHHETADRSMLIQRLKDDEDAHHKYDPEWLDESPTEQEVQAIDVIKKANEVADKFEWPEFDELNLKGKEYEAVKKMAHIVNEIQDILGIYLEGEYKLWKEEYSKPEQEGKWSDERVVQFTEWLTAKMNKWHLLGKKKENGYDWLMHNEYKEHYTTMQILQMFKNQQPTPSPEKEEENSNWQEMSNDEKKAYFKSHQNETK